MNREIMTVLSKQLLIAIFVMMSAGAQAGLQEANEALAGKNYKAAIKELEPLAVQGDANAQHLLADIYNNGSGVTMDEKLAVAWYRKAAAQGFVKSQTMLGIMYENGAGVKLNYKTAMSWYRKAAEQGEPDAQSLLGAMYAEGLGVTADMVQALKWFTLAANSGYEIGQQNIKAVETKMTSKQIKQARTLAEEWKKVHSNK